MAFRLLDESVVTLEPKAYLESETSNYAVKAVMAAESATSLTVQFVAAIRAMEVTDGFALVADNYWSVALVVEEAIEVVEGPVVVVVAAVVAAPAAAAVAAVAVGLAEVVVVEHSKALKEFVGAVAEPSQAAAREALADHTFHD